MKWSTNSAPSSDPPVLPTTCPACGSSSIVTAARIPDADSYWRCETCGEVWNVSRTQVDRHGGGRRWR